MGTDVQDLTARAKKLFSERRYQESVRVCRRVLLSRPDEIPVRLLLGMALLVLRRYDEVRVEMMAVIRRDPSQGPAHRLLGEAYLRSGQADKAQDALRQAAALDPDDQATRELMAEVEDEDAPVSETIERWFNPELVGTVQTDLPELEGEQTTIQADPGARPSPRQDPPVPSPLSPESTTAARPAATRAIESAPTLAVSPERERPPQGTNSSSVGQSATGTDELDVQDIEPLEGAAAATGSEDALDAEPTVARPRVPRAEPAPHAPAAPFASPAYAADPASAAAAEWAELQPHGSPPDDPALEEERTRARSHPDALDAEPTRARSAADALDAEPTRARPSVGPPGWHDASAPAVGPRPASAPAPAPVPPGPMFAHSPPPAPPSSPAAAPRPAFVAPPPAGAGAGPALRPMPAEPRPRPAEPTPSHPRSTEPTPSHPRSTERTPSSPRSAKPAPPELDPTDRLPPQRGAQGPLRQRLEPLLARVRPSYQRLRARLPNWPTPLLVAAGVLPLAAVVGIVVGVFVALERRGGREIDLAIRKATADGLNQSLARAIHIDKEEGSDDPEALARRARLYSMALLEHGVEADAAVRKLLGQLEGEATSLPDARVALAYLALANGDVQRAREAVARVRGEGDVAVEAARARALAAFAAGDLQGALEHATAAVSERPGTPRHVSLSAWLTARYAGPPGVQEALNSLDAVPRGDDYPSIHLARARVLQIAEADRERVAKEARAVLQAPEEVVSKYQKASAHLVLARQAVRAGDTSVADRHAREAAELGPPYDEDFGLAVASILLRIGDPALAGSVLERLPTQSYRPDQRALLQAEVALARGDVDAAEGAIEGLQESPKTAYVRGRVAQQRGEGSRARRHFDRAADDPELYLQAQLRLAAMALEEGEPGRAVELLTTLRTRAPTDAELIPLLVRALLADGEPSKADEVVTEALEQEPSFPALIIAKARVEMAQGETNQALNRLRELSGKRPRDVELHAVWGQLAAKAGRRRDARDALKRALELDPDRPEVLLAKAELALSEQDADKARSALEAAREAAADPDALARMEGRLMVLEGGGLEAVEALERVPAAMREASEWSALGRAYAQAENHRQAQRAFRQALRQDKHDVESLLGLSLLEVRAGRLSAALGHVRDAQRAARRNEVNEVVESRVLAAQGRIKFEYGPDEAKELADRALAKDPENADAHLLLAHVADTRGNDWEEHLRDAVKGRAPLPEALALLALELGKSDEGCELARRYLLAAPNGYDARDVKRLRAKCR